MSEIMLTEENFENEVMKSDVPVLVDFWATWCGPCRMIAPIVRELATEYAGKMKVGKVNVDEQPRLAAAFNIVSIPTIMIFKNGILTNKVIGFKPKQELEMLIK